MSRRILGFVPVAATTNTIADGNHWLGISPSLDARGNLANCIAASDAYVRCGPRDNPILDTETWRH